MALLAAAWLWTAPIARGDWRQQAALDANDAAGWDGFGQAVALDDGLLAVGAPSSGGSGAVYLFRLGLGGWLQEAKLTAADGAWGDGFGFSVALSGETIVVGAWNDDGPAGDDSGSVYVFGRVGAIWQEQGRLVASDAARGDSFGCSVGISGDDIVVGSFGDCDAGTSSGSAYVFHRDGVAWQETKLAVSDASKGQFLGWSVSIDGDRIACGAYGDGAGGPKAGAVYVFARQDGAWGQQAKVVASDAAANDWFGRSVAVGGGWLLAGAPQDDDGGENAGAAYVYRPVDANGQVAWVQEARLTACDAAAGNLFGSQVAIDADQAVVAAPGHVDPCTGALGVGAVYVFERGEGGWSELARLAPAGAAAGGQAGESICLDDGRVAAGAPGDGDPDQAGSAYLFEDVTRTAWRGPPSAQGEWFDANNWSKGVPAGDVDAHIENGGIARVPAGKAVAKTLCVGCTQDGALDLSGPLEVQGLHLGAYGRISAGAGADLRILGDLENHLTEANRFDLSGCTVRFAPAAGLAGPYRLEAAGADLAADPCGWVGNFAFATLIVEPEALVRLVDLFDNQLDGGGNEAVYADTLVLAGAIDPNGRPLYYRNGGAVKKLFVGDADLSGRVDYEDYKKILQNFTQAPAGRQWPDGDFDADGDVDYEDYKKVLQSFGSAWQSGGGPPAAIPEPATLLLLAAAAAATLRRRQSGA